MIFAPSLTVMNRVSDNHDLLKPSTHAGSTGLTGLSGLARVCVRSCMHILALLNQLPSKAFVFLAHESLIMLTLLTLLRANRDRGLSVSGLSSNLDIPCYAQEVAQCA